MKVPWETNEETKDNNPAKENEQAIRREQKKCKKPKTNQTEGRSAEDKRSRIVKNREIHTTRLLPSASDLTYRAALFIIRMNVSPNRSI